MPREAEEKQLSSPSFPFPPLSHHFQFLTIIQTFWGGWAELGGQQDGKEAEECGQGAQGRPYLSLSLSVYPRNLGKTKTVSGWDEKVLPVQQVCTEGGELSEDAIFSCTLLYSVTDWNHKVKPNTLDVVFVFQVLSCNGQQRLFKNRRSPSLNTFRVVLVFIFLEQHLSAQGATGHWNVRLQWHWVYF